jgi:hypothetical protein
LVLVLAAPGTLWVWASGHQHEHQETSLEGRSPSKPPLTISKIFRDTVRGAPETASE